MRNMRYYNIKIEPIYEHVMNDKYQMIIRNSAQGRDTFSRTDLTSQIRREKDLSISVGDPSNAGRLFLYVYIYVYIYVPDASSRITEKECRDTSFEIEPVQFRGNTRDFTRLPESPTDGKDNRSFDRHSRKTNRDGVFSRTTKLFPV